MKIIVDFKNLVSELNTKQIKLCFLRNRGLFIEDGQNNLYQMETYRVGSYLDRLIQDGIKVEFHKVEKALSMNIGDWEKKIWDISEVKDFMKSQRLVS
ncbi:hypothetical protein [Bacillus infantis]|uniref:hypothetical protein n=1 Tax=Bacillus infantis TaxID=324767 RepID=UPI003CEF0E51